MVQPILPANVAPRSSSDGPLIRRVELYSTIEPGGSGLALPLLWDPVGDPTAVPPTGPGWYWWHDLEKLRTVYDPAFICCGFREERVWVRWCGHSQRWIVTEAFGLNRKAVIAGSLSVNSSTAATIQQIQRDGVTIESLPITVYGWQISNSTSLGGRIDVFFDGSDKKWYTGAYRRA